MKINPMLKNESPDEDWAEAVVEKNKTKIEQTMVLNLLFKARYLSEKMML